ncbi:MAG TPA: glycyl-radical enzyme activating protein [Deltaproteobacteria bacterium]|nr:glycyl-radical enzyme activating protein [Deltaproteobacteria bacterium]
MNNPQGFIHAIERFSIHDGPGIRTLVIMKGCPLSCRWCSSPHTQSPKPEILHIKTRCQGCGRCLAACKNGAISTDVVKALVKTDRSRCIGCGHCILTCPNRAREISGRYYTTEELFREVKKDAAIYRRSGGGITVGGGEPTMQAEFVLEFLSLCRSYLFHTAMETSAHTPWEKLSSLLSCLDLVCIDVKHMRKNRHREWTGVSNNLILQNIKRAAKIIPLILRVPIIPGFNDTEENISETACFARNLGSNLLRLELLPYHRYGIHKYEELDRAYTIESLKPPSDEHLTTLRDIVRSAGIDCELGG